ncbi:hypothetical protein [Rhizobacter sp. LjRoot28]|uniref:hypothetical protein n=1 Tax=Rhizobacter sp. LjRoot28 TaxID=3342309 RepID=UPI003ED10BED
MSKKNEKAVIRAAMALTVAALASGCGGSGENETAEPSADQKAFEALIVAPGASYGLSWNLPYSGTPVSGTHHAVSDFASLPASPAGGAQKTTQAPRVNLARTLAMPPAAPSRFLKDGVVLVVPDAELSHVTRYVGADVLVDTLASDGRTVAHTQRRSGFSTVALAGLVRAAPGELAHWYNSFWSNTLILDATRSFLPGAAYVTYTATNVGDRYAVFDCTTVTTSANVSPCASGTTLELALVSGIRSNSDGRTYGPTDGSFVSAAGVSMWIASQARPVEATLSLTPQYRIYFERGGNVYTGSLTRHGAVLSSSYCVSNPDGATALDRLTFLPYQVRLNKAAHDSIAAALKI